MLNGYSLGDLGGTPTITIRATWTYWRAPSPGSQPSPFSVRRFDITPLRGARVETPNLAELSYSLG
jgi:hypothetical protein